MKRSPSSPDFCGRRTRNVPGKPPATRAGGSPRGCSTRGPALLLRDCRGGGSGAAGPGEAHQATLGWGWAMRWSPGAAIASDGRPGSDSKAAVGQLGRHGLVPGTGGRKEISIEGGRDAGGQESGKSTRARELHAAAADAPSLGSAAS